MFEKYSETICSLSRLVANDGQYLLMYTWHLLYLLVYVKILFNTISEMLQHFSVELTML